MFQRRRFLSAVLVASLVGGGGLAACSRDDGTERWVTTENTNVKIDWSKLNEAYKAAEGPEDLEKRVNELYEGDELISVSVQDQDDKTQVVTGFFDKNLSGNIDEGEKIFTIKRVITGEGKASAETVGYGAYAGYHSPMWDIATGMLLGSMISRAFSPGYMPMYTTGYMTSPTRASQIAASRQSFRTANPERFSKSTKSGRAWGGQRTAPSRSGGGGFRPSRSGGGFGAAPRTTTATRLA